MTKRSHLLLAPVFGLAGAALRFFQCRVVFEPDTMLSRPHFISAVLPVYLLLCAVFFAVKSGKKKTALDFDAAFAVPGQQLLPGFTFSALLFVPAGACIAMDAMGGSTLLLVLGGGAAAAGVCLFLALVGWRKGNHPGILLLVPVFFGLFWLFLTYQEYAAWPVMEVYFVQVLAIAALTYGFYQVSACAFSQGSSRALRFILPLAVVLTFTSLGDSVSLAMKGLYLASLGTLFGFSLSLKNQ